ncbi:hypothetical protein JKP88DRAFT_337476 [Tribonema minus]|uniref:Uncharacterized protein n=1 Tax=Tribonema minus TaxID=303371 RepID=A0A835YI20_9STRA|nr:hypothetical protein JKP88DRAFT_337476 [Tribonema minus]
MATMTLLYEGLKEATGDDPDALAAMPKNPISGLLFAEEDFDRLAAECTESRLPGYTVDSAGRVVSVATRKPCGTALRPTSPDAIARCNAAVAAVPPARVLLVEGAKPSDWSQALFLTEFSSSLAAFHGAAVALCVRDVLQANEAVIAAFKGRQTSTLMLGGGNGSSGGGGSGSGECADLEGVDVILVAEPDPRLWECCMMYLE